MSAAKAYKPEAGTPAMVRILAARGRGAAMARMGRRRLRTSLRRRGNVTIASRPSISLGSAPRNSKKFVLKCLGFYGFKHLCLVV